MERWLRIWLAAVCLIAGTGLTGPSGAAPASPPAQKFVYSVHHSRYGRIGTYSNTIMHDGDQTSVKTEVRIAVSFLGFVVYRQEGLRQERWAGDRLVFFHGVTSTNGKSIELNGTAEGDRFVLTTPQGATVAPADVRIANPWSPGILGGNSIFTPDRGRLDEVRVSGGEAASLDVDGRQVHAKKYEVYLLDGSKKYEVDLDEHGTPVQFVLFRPDGDVTFSLTG